MSLRINDQAPNFNAYTTQGKIEFHEWIGQSWAVLFSHPKDFTPVCTTELAKLATLQPEFEKRNAKVIGLSVDNIKDHKEWLKDVEDLAGTSIDYPVIADTDLTVSKLYSMFPADESGSAESRTALTNATVRSVFVVGPDKNIKLTLTYPMSTGRNFDEILRVIDSIQLTAEYKVATPANWQSGEDVIIAPSISNEEAKSIYADGWETVKPYLRKVKQPS
tara:strand:+ start:958 stop:1617 length:660 start_codon:yes stop_codon:yes gene_type:complete